MRKSLAISLALLSVGGTAQAQTASYQIENQDTQGSSVRGDTSTSLTDSVGDTSTIIFAGQPSPSVTIVGATGPINGAYANAQASFTYRSRIIGLNQNALPALIMACQAKADCLAGPVGTATGSYTLSGSSGSYAAVSLTINGRSLGADCDSGRFGSDCGTHSYSTDIYIPELVCDQSGGPGTCSVDGVYYDPFVFEATLSAEGDVYGGSNERVLSSIDPVFSLNESFFTNLGLSASDYSLSFDQGIGNGGSNGAVPEPASWATMILGFGIMGGALRRQRAALAL